MKLIHLGALGYALCSIYLWPSKVAAALVNGTIDDRFGDSVTHRLVSYYPQDANAWSDESACGCDPLNKSKAFDNTFTLGYSYAGTPTGFRMQFIGTAIYVFFLIFGSLSDITPKGFLNSANFTLDSNKPLFFGTEAITVEYDVLVFSQTNLSNAIHTLNITVPTYAYAVFDYAIYTYDDGVSTTTSSLSLLPNGVSTTTSSLSSLSKGVPTTTSSLSSLSAVTTMSQTPFTTVTGAPARRTPVGAIVGGIAGGITLFALVISLLFRWYRRGGHGVLQSVRGNGGPEPLITQFNFEAATLASGMPYPQSPAVRSKSPMATVIVSGGEPSNTDNQANMRSKYRTLRSEGVVLSSPNSQQLPSSSRKPLPLSSSNNRVASPLLPSPLNVTGTREEIRRARQEDLDNRLRVVQHNIVQLEESRIGSGRSVSLREQISGEAGEEMHMSVPDMQETIQSLREQIRVVREQQQSAWALGLSDDPPPGYTPMEVGMRISREALS